jgi:hypothetical protein
MTTTDPSADLPLLDAGLKPSRFHREPLDRAGLADRAGPRPHNGRAPGWDAGITVARRLRADAPSGISAPTSPVRALQLLEM